jgi:hypothetical protein
MFKALLLEPSQVSHRPTLLAWEDAPVLEHEGAHLLPMYALGLDGRRPRTNQITHGFVALVGNPHWRQFASAEKLGQTNGVTPIGLHSVAGFPWD